MRIKASRQFSTWFDGIKSEGGVRLELIGALLGELYELNCKPTTESATFKRVRQARRHEIWRVAHPFVEGVAVRILCWFDDQESVVVVALVGGDKGPIGDVWYTSAAGRAEAVLDDWLRQQNTGKEAG